MDTTNSTQDPHPERRPLRRAASSRRRPSGEPPPLPRQLGRTGKFWLIMALYFSATAVGVLLFPTLARYFERWDTERQRWIVSLRISWLTDVTLVVNWLTSHWAIRILRWSTLIVLIAFRRWRHLFVFLGAIIVLEILAYQMTLLSGRPRPLGVTILAPWTGFSLPSRPVAGLAVTLMGMAYALVVPGRHRYYAKWTIGVILGVVWFTRMYLGVDQPTSAGFAAILGVAIGLTAFRWFTPNDIFPVSYKRGKAAHLDVSGRRGEAIVSAIKDQLGLEVVAVKPVGLEASGGSTPLRMTVAATNDEPQHYVFAKLYAQSHVRADRWYKLGRTILYGALEDETPFKTVRRFVEYEDYTLRLMYDEGLPAPKPYGVVEITPEREYMIVMEFFEDSLEIGDAEVTDHVVDQGLELVRRMWDMGLAHRDIKPANLMVQRGELRLIDVFFVQVRPSPWRQAVDLANMMMVLALRTDAPRVYQHALRLFSPDDIAEAFAATRGVASPTQLRTMMKQQGRDLLAEFRALAPARAPVRIQRWSLRRIALTLGVVFAAFLSVSIVVGNWAVFA